MRLIGNVETLALARVAIEKFNDEAEPLTRGFPRAADKARGLLAAINAVLPPVGSPLLPDLSSKILTESEVQRIHAFHSAIFPTLRDESMHSYVVKFEDQRCLSSYTLVEKIESCFPPHCWDIIDKSAKREFEECGRCLSMERYTASGFHALRGVECVIRQYILALTSSLPRKRDWGSYIDVLQQSGADTSAVVVLDNIRTLERNPLMHPEDWLDVDDAVGIFNISTTAVVRLAGGIKKTQKRNVTVHDVTSGVP